MDLIDKVKDILLDELNLETIGDDAKQEDFHEWDSLAYLSIVAALEDEFGLQIAPENIENFNSIPNIIKEIEKAKNNS